MMSVKYMYGSLVQKGHCKIMTDLNLIFSEAKPARFSSFTCKYMYM